MFPKFNNYFIVFVLSFLITNVCGQNKYENVAVGFYNLENLFDTEDDPAINDEEFLPEGAMKWDEVKYRNKLNNMAKVISIIGQSEGFSGGPALLGVSEIENRRVLEDLIATPPLNNEPWRIIHHNSPDRRGIDVALLYKATAFQPRNVKPYRLTIPGEPNFLTRDQLLISGMLLGEEVHIIVNHWPSRRGGEKESRPFRNAAAKLSRHIADSLLTLDKNAKIMIMGDFNDDPINESVLVHLNTGDGKKVAPGQLINPMFSMFNSGQGSLAYYDAWNLFDQIIISQGLFKTTDNSFALAKAVIVKDDFLFQKEGRYKGYPLRTHAGGAYLNGYSDHLPVMLVLKRKKR